MALLPAWCPMKVLEYVSYDVPASTPTTVFSSPPPTYAENPTNVLLSPPPPGWMYDPNDDELLPATFEFAPTHTEYSTGPDKVSETVASTPTNTF